MRLPDFYVVELLNERSKFEPVWNTATGFVLNFGERKDAIALVSRDYPWHFAARAFRIVSVY